MIYEVKEDFLNILKKLSVVRRLKVPDFSSSETEVNLRKVLKLLMKRQSHFSKIIVLRF